MQNFVKLFSSHLNPYLLAKVKLMLQVLIKSGSGSGEKTTVPKNVPFMLPIIHYHETDTAIYLVLKFIRQVSI